MGILTLISTATASDASSVEITSGIDSTYDEYMFVFTDINPATDDTHFSFQTSIDGGSNYNVTTTTTYFRAYHTESDSSGLGQQAVMDQAQGTAFQNLYESGANDADASLAGELHLFSPSSTTYVKHFYSRVTGMGSSPFTADAFVAGYFNDADDDINAIQFKMSSGNLDGVIQMYGIA